MKIIIIIAICLLIIVTIMIVWGTLTHWKFKRDNYEKQKVLKLLQQGIEDSSEYQNVGNQLSDYF